ncbi:unnamed protein product [Cyprideis torosa]|uniref:Uncharacterized protein n=1 Tax=Cyprideis torosa TaxID=163714 RepID=A0A7R8W3X1_9CRUS|nr:unnamed protein product [Cyprideis torosa]CAG0881331.1 unnamed protein product [Cyprideis torosa]
MAAEESEIPGFRSSEEEVAYWKELALRYKNSADELRDEYEEFQQSSRELEQELETQLEQNETRIRDLRTSNNRLLLENETLKNLLHRFRLNPLTFPKYGLSEDRNFSGALAIFMTVTYMDTVTITTNEVALWWTLPSGGSHPERVYHLGLRNLTAAFFIDVSRLAEQAPRSSSVVLALSILGIVLLLEHCEVIHAIEMIPSVRYASSWNCHYFETVWNPFPCSYRSYHPKDAEMALLRRLHQGTQEDLFLGGILEINTATN